MVSHRNDLLFRPRRIYTAVAVEAREGGFEIVLDGRGAKTPAGGALRLPTRALADVAAAEWAAQGEWVDYATMHATRLAFTAIDRAEGAREGLADEVARFAGADLLCYFAEGPEPLLEREIAHWGPVLAWAESDLGLRFERVTGLSPHIQPAETLERVRARALSLDAFALAGLGFAASVFGSAILALAVQRGQLTGDAAFDLSRLDQAFQEERWGVDAEAAERTAGLRREAQMIGRWFEALRD